MPSKEKDKIVIDYSKGLTPYSGTIIPEGGSPDLDQVEAYRGHIRRAMGMNPFSDGVLIADELPCLLDQYFITTGTTYLQIITDTTARQFLAGAPDTYPSRGAHAVALTTSNNPDLFIDGEVAEDLHLITDGVNPIRKVSGAGNYASLGGSIASGTIATKLTAGCMIYFKTHLLVGDTTENSTAFPYRIRRSDTADIETWNGDNNSGYNDLLGATDIVRLMRPLIDRIIVYRDNTIWDGVFVGYPDMFLFTRRISQTGLLARKSLVSHTNYHIGLFTESVGLYDGVQLQDITGTLRPLLFGANSEMNMEFAGNAVGKYINELNEYWLAVPLGAEEYPTKFFRYHLPSKSWWKKDFKKQIYCSGAWDEVDNTTWDNIGTATTTWDEVADIWNAKTLGAGQELTLWGSDNDGGGDTEFFEIDYSAITDDGEVPTAQYTTKDFKFSASDRWNSFWVECEGSGTLEVFYSSDEGTNFTSLGTGTVPSDFKWVKFWINKTLQKCRFKVVLSDADCHIRQMIGYYRKRNQ